MQDRPMLTQAMLTQVMTEHDSQNEPPHGNAVPDKDVGAPPLPHLTGEKREEKPILRFIRGFAFAIVGASIMMWEVSNRNHATSTALTTGAAFIGLCLALFGVYEVEQWKNKVLADAKAKRRKENAE